LEAEVSAERSMPATEKNCFSNSTKRSRRDEMWIQTYTQGKYYFVALNNHVN
jgi:hypothetical protein